MLKYVYFFSLSVSLISLSTKPMLVNHSERDVLGEEFYSMLVEYNKLNQVETSPDEKAISKCYKELLRIARSDRKHYLQNHFSKVTYQEKVYLSPLKDIAQEK